MGNRQHLKVNTLSSETDPPLRPMLTINNQATERRQLNKRLTVLLLQFPEAVQVSQVGVRPTLTRMVERN